MMSKSLFLLLVTYVVAVQKFYTQSTANTFGDFSLGAGYDINRYEPKAAHLFKEGSEDLLYDIMPITSTKTRCALITSQKDIGDKLYVHGSLSITYNMITGSGEITYDQKKETMSKVAYYTCTVDRTLYTISVNAPAPKGDMASVLSDNVAGLVEEQDVKDVVGDYHIRSITYGRRYNTEIRMEYTTEDAFEKISGKLKAEIGVGALSVSAEVALEKDWHSYEEDLTLTVASEALGFVEPAPLFLPSKSVHKVDENGKRMKDEETGEYIMLSTEDQIDAMLKKNLDAFNAIDLNKTMEPKTGLSKEELFKIMGDAYPLWYTVEKNQPYFAKLTKLSPFQEQQMLRNLDQAYDIMRELEDMTENIQTRAQLLFDSYHLLSGATELSLEFLKYRQSLMNTIVKYRKEVLDYIKLYPIDIAEKDIYFWAAQDEDRELEYVSMDILHTKVWDLLGMEDVPMDDKNEIGATCLFNGIQATIDNSTDRRKFAGRVVFGDLTVRHVLFDVSGKVVSLGYIDHEHDNRDNETWSGVAHELVFVREDCTLLKKGSDVWYQDSRYTISSIGSDEHLTPRGYVNKEKLTNIRLHLQPKDTTRQIQVVITHQEVKDVDLRGHENSYGFTVDLQDRLMYKNGYVCDHLFQKKEANMICTALGYEDVLYYKTGYEIPAANAWGRPHITMTNLDCDLMARDVEDCKMLTGEEMDELQSPWTHCTTQNGVQLKCVNNWVRNKKSSRMEVEAKNVACSRNEEAIGTKIDTAEECSGGAGDQASNFGNVDKVTVKGSICVKLIRDDQLDCVVHEDSAAWDFTNAEVLNRFCYGDSLNKSLSLSEDKLPFPETIQMISENREEPCVEDDSVLKQAKLKVYNGTRGVALEECKIGREFGLCNKDGKFEADIKIDDLDHGTFLDLCPKTCKICTPNPRKHYNVTVNVEKSVFAVDRGEAVTVTINDADTKRFESNSQDTEKVSFEKEFHCGDKIRIAAKVDDGEYDHGFVTCSVQIVDIETSDARIDEDGYVLIDGDIEVTFQCVNPPSMAPSTDQPTRKPTNAPSSTPSMTPSAAPNLSPPTVFPTSSSPSKAPYSSPTKAPSSSPSKAPIPSCCERILLEGSPNEVLNGVYDIVEDITPSHGLPIYQHSHGTYLFWSEDMSDWLLDSDYTDGTKGSLITMDNTKACPNEIQSVSIANNGGNWEHNDQIKFSCYTADFCFFNERKDTTCEEAQPAKGGVLDVWRTDISVQECEQACKNTNACQIFVHMLHDEQPVWGQGLCVLYESCGSYSDESDDGKTHSVMREKKPECSVSRRYTSGSTFTEAEAFDCLTHGSAHSNDVRAMSVPIDPKGSFSVSFDAEITDMSEDVDHFGSIIQISDSAGEVCFRMTTNHFRQSTCDDGNSHYWYLMKRSSGSFSVFCDGVEQTASMMAWDKHMLTIADCEVGPLNVVIGAHTKGDLSQGWCRVKGTFSNMLIESWTGCEYEFYEQFSNADSSMALSGPHILSIEDCKSLCCATEDCSGFDYSRSGEGRCYLKNSLLKVEDLSIRDGAWDHYRLLN